MAKTLNLICHLEPIQATYVPGWTDFWLCVSAGYDWKVDADAPTPDELERLKTWNWPAWAGVTLLGRSAGSAFAEVPLSGETFALLDWPGGAVGLHEIHRRLDVQFDRALRCRLDANDPNAIARHPFRVALDTRDVDMREADDASKSQRVVWSAVLAQSSGAVGGLGLRLRTSICFRVRNDALAGSDELLAAPVFSEAFEGGSPLKGRAPGNAQPFPDPANPNPGPGDPLRWEYLDDAATGLPIMAVQPPTSVQPSAPDPASLFDPKSLMRKKGAFDESTSYDWTERLEARLAELFDLPWLLIEVLRQQGQEGAPVVVKPGTLPAFNALFLASLRDAAGLGVNPSVSGISVATLVQRQAEVPGDVGPIDRTFDTKTWGERLKKVLREVARTEPVVPDSAAAPDAYLDQLNCFRSAVLDEATHRALVLSQWSDAIEASPVQNKADARARVASALQDLHPNLPHELLSAVLAPALATFSRDYSSDGDALAQDVADCVRRYVLERATSAGAYAPFYPQLALPDDLSALADAAAALAAKRVRDKIASAGEFNPDKPELLAEGLVIRVADVAAAKTTDADDIRKTIAGAGVLMRRTGGPSVGRWHYLNYALPRPAAVFGDEAVPVPVRLDARNGLNVGQVVYQNRPLAGPVADETNVERVEPASDPNVDDDRPLVDLDTAYGAKARKLLGLQYGATYDVAVHYVGRGGHLPPALTGTSADPEALLPWRLDREDRWNVQPANIIPMTYRRRVGFGAVRLAAVTTNALTKQTEPASFPPIPEGVRPVARRWSRGATRPPMSIRPLARTIPTCCCSCRMTPRGGIRVTSNTPSTCARPRSSTRCGSGWWDSRATSSSARSCATGIAAATRLPASASSPTNRSRSMTLRSARSSFTWSASGSTRTACPPLRSTSRSDCPNGWRCHHDPHSIRP
ncbi:MAG: hypothetical protein QM770_04650 [Tepidisphaeraceae bacterium]